ncbi:hypothetical protein VD0002_g2154 [Verticillium dahliae]|nr:hypothetical protein VD0003_g3333 [Verticillium dahliae]PNH67615.1 hypothetical protein VD0002_g2154 [Verticillium dahliae]
MARGLMQNSSSSLTPFLANVDGQFWTSDMARYTQDFGYTYAETSSLGTTGLSGVNMDDRARVSLAINRLYGSSSPSMLARKQKSTDRDIFPERGTNWLQWHAKVTNAIKNRIPDLSPQAEPRVPPLELERGAYTEWLANVRVINGALNGSFSVLFFLGSVPQDVVSWKASSNLVGTMGVFAMPRMGSGSGNHISGTVPLTKALLRAIDQGFLGQLDQAEVTKYLQDNLQFRIVGHDGTVADAQQVRGLCVEVASSDVKMAMNEWELPSWGQVRTRFNMVC